MKTPSKKSGRKRAVKPRYRKDIGRDRNLALRQTRAQEGLTDITRRLAAPLWIAAAAGVIMATVSIINLVMAIM